MGNNGKKPFLKREKMLDPDLLRELQEKLRKQAQESLELREGYSIQELLQDARKARTARP